VSRERFLLESALNRTLDDRFYQLQDRPVLFDKLSTQIALCKRLPAEAVFHRLAEVPQWLVGTVCIRQGRPIATAAESIPSGVVRLSTRMIGSGDRRHIAGGTSLR
jgi:hypothetical protein